MAENETDSAATATTTTTASSSSAPEQDETQAAATNTEEITYHAVEKDGHVTAIWEMQGPVHLRTIDPRSRQGQEILRLYTADHHDEANTQEATAS